jgi:hypothetical protein
MSRMLTLLADLYRRWKYVEDTAPDSPAAPRRSTDLRTRLVETIDRERRIIGHFRRNGCRDLAADREPALRSAERRLRELVRDRRRVV